MIDKEFIKLTASQYRLAEYVSEGLTDSQIAARWGITREAAHARYFRLVRNLGMDFESCNPRVVIAIKFERGEYGYENEPRRRGLTPKRQALIERARQLGLRPITPLNDGFDDIVQ